MQQLLPQLVERGAEILGGLDRLANYLRLPEHTVRFWLAGRANAPQGALFILVDLVLKDDVARAREDRRRHPRSEGSPGEGAEAAGQKPLNG